MLDLLRQHPQFADHFAPKLDAVPADARDRYLLMLAARWPDDVRRNKQYHHGSWHYVNLPYAPGGQEVRPTPIQNILTAYAENVAIVKGKGSPAPKAVALCWLFHLIGDVHQPLHTVALFTPDYLEGDRGGNLAFVRVRAGGQILNLHSLWDGLVIGSARFQDVRNEATRLRLRKALARDKLGELSEERFERWAEAESFELARRVVYREGKVTGNPERDAAPVLLGGYTDEAKAVAERQIVRARRFRARCPIEPLARGLGAAGGQGDLGRSAAIQRERLLRSLSFPGLHRRPSSTNPRARRVATPTASGSRRPNPA